MYIFHNKEDSFHKKSLHVSILQTFLFFCVIFRPPAWSQIIFGFDLDICKKKFPFRFLPFGQDICQDPWRFIALDISVLIDDCLLYTSDAADDSLRVDLGGRRII